MRLYFFQTLLIVLSIARLLKGQTVQLVKNTPDAIILNTQVTFWANQAEVSISGV